MMTKRQQSMARAQKKLKETAPKTSRKRQNSEENICSKANITTSIRVNDMLAHWRRTGSKGNALRKRELQHRILTAKKLQVGRRRGKMWSPRWQVGRGRDQK